MKSLLVTAMMSMGVAHSGAFLAVWELPYVKDHLTVSDLSRKLNKVMKWGEFNDSLRQARDEAREENFKMYEEERGKRNTWVVGTGQSGHHQPMKSRVSRRR